MLKLIAPLSKKRPTCTNDQDTDSESENISIARTSTPGKTTIATNSKTTPSNSRNNCVFLPFEFRCFQLRMSVLPA